MRRVSFLLRRDDFAVLARDGDAARGKAALLVVNAADHLRASAGSLAFAAAAAVLDHEGLLEGDGGADSVAERADGDTTSFLVSAGGRFHDVGATFLWFVDVEEDLSAAGRMG